MSKVSAFNKSFVEGFVPAFQQSAAAYNAAQQDKTRAAIAARAAQEARQRELSEQAAPYGGAVIGDDGSVNAVATAAKIAREQRKMDAIKEAANQRFTADLSDFRRARALGINAPEPSLTYEPDSPAAGPLNGTNVPQYLRAPGAPLPFLAPNRETIGAPPLEQQIASAQRQAELAKKAAERDASAQAELAKFIPLLPGGRSAVKYDDAGNFDDETARALLEASYSDSLNRSRNAAVFAARDDVKTMYPDLKEDDPTYNFRLNQRKLYHSGPKEYKLAINQVGDLYASNPTEWRKEVDRVAAMGGFAQPRTSAAMEKTLSDWNTLQANQQKLISLINEHNAKFPEAPLDAMVGPIDNRTLRANLAVNDRASPAAKSAQQVLGFFQGISNQRLKDLSGAAVTDGEFERFLKETGDPESANFINAVLGWHDATARKYQSQLDALSGYSFPESIARVNGKMPEEWVGYYLAPAGPGAGATQPATSAEDILTKYGIAP